MRIWRWNRLVLVLLAVALATPSIVASADDAVTDDAAADNPWTSVEQSVQRGPQAIALRDQAKLQLPAGFGFVPTAPATALMEAMGNDVDADFIGLVLPLAKDGRSIDADAPWLISVDYRAEGYIKDDDAKNWNAEELLASLKEGTEAGNERRERLGIAPIEVTRWIETPAYDGTSQRLVWSAEARDKGAAADADNTVNYNTYVLGREGYISLDLITTTSGVEAQKPFAKTLLSNVAFVDGKRYADYDASTDKLAAYGLAALVGGVAAKKLGLLALAGVFFAKFFKIIAVAVVAGGAALKKFLGRKA